MLPGTERNVYSGVLMLWNGTSGNITHVVCSLGSLYTSLETKHTICMVRLSKVLHKHKRATDKVTLRTLGARWSQKLSTILEITQNIQGLCKSPPSQYGLLWQMLKKNLLAILDWWKHPR